VKLAHHLDLSAAAHSAQRVDGVQLQGQPPLAKVEVEEEEGQGPVLGQVGREGDDHDEGVLQQPAPLWKSPSPPDPLRVLGLGMERQARAAHFLSDCW